MKKTLSFLLILAIPIIIFSDDVIALIWYIADHADELTSNVGWIATSFSVFMYIKLRFYDTRMFTKLQNVYGKQKFIDALEVILEMLKVMSPAAVISKVSAISDIEIEMRKAIEEIRRQLTPNNDPDDLYQIKLTRKESKDLNRKIKGLISIMEKRLELHYLGKSVGIDASDNLIDFETQLKKSIDRLPKLKKFEKENRKKGRSDILRNL